MEPGQLNSRRKKVLDVIGAVNMRRYLYLMGCWFKGKMTKDEFDEQARGLFSDDTVKAHNEFLLAMLRRCQSVSNTLGSRDLNRVPSVTPTSQPAVMSKQKACPVPVKKKAYVKPNFSQRFQPANQLRQVQAVTSPPSQTTRLPFASSDHGLLPDAAMVEGRLFVSAWEAGLDSVQNETYSLIAHATEHLLKNIVTHVISSRRGYRISRSNHMKQYVGIDAPVCYLESVYNPNHTPDHPLHIDNCLLKAQKEEADSVQSLARTGHVIQSNQPISAQDMFAALQADPAVIASHVVYTLAMERLSTRLYHPSQEQMMAKHTEAYTQLARQRLIANSQSISGRRQTNTNTS